MVAHIFHSWIRGCRVENSQTNTNVTSKNALNEKKTCKSNSMSPNLLEESKRLASRFHNICLSWNALESIWGWNTRNRFCVMPELVCRTLIMSIKYWTNSQVSPNCLLRSEKLLDKNFVFCYFCNKKTALKPARWLRSSKLPKNHFGNFPFAYLHKWKLFFPFCMNNRTNKFSRAARAGSILFILLCITVIVELLQKNSCYK